MLAHWMDIGTDECKASYSEHYWRHHAVEQNCRIFSEEVSRFECVDPRTGQVESYLANMVTLPCVCAGGSEPLGREWAPPGPETKLLRVRGAGAWAAKAITWAETQRSTRALCKTARAKMEGVLDDCEFGPPHSGEPCFMSLGNRAASSHVTPPDIRSACAHASLDRDGSHGAVCAHASLDRGGALTCPVAPIRARGPVSDELRGAYSELASWLGEADGLVCLGRAIAVVAWDATQRVAGECAARVVAAAVYTLVFEWEGYGAVATRGPGALFSPAKRSRLESSQVSGVLLIGRCLRMSPRTPHCACWSSPWSFCPMGIRDCRCFLCCG